MSTDLNQTDRITTFLNVTGTSNEKLNFLANLSPTVSEPESNWSVIGQLAHRPDINWKKMYEAEAWLTAMDESAGGSIFAVSVDGRLHSGIAGQWSELDLHCPGLNAIWAASDNEAFAVGEKDVRVRALGGNVNTVVGAEGNRLNAVHGTSSKNVVAVGDNGLIMRFNGNEWTELDSATNYNLLAVLCRSETEVYIAGAAGILLLYDGATVRQIDTAVDYVFSGLAWYRGSLHLAAGQNGIGVLGAGGVEQIKTLVLYKIKVIGELLFGWGNNLIAQYDGAGWWGGRIDI